MEIETVKEIVTNIKSSTIESKEVEQHFYRYNAQEESIENKNIKQLRT